MEGNRYSIRIGRKRFKETGINIDAANTDTVTRWWFWHGLGGLSFLFLLFFLLPVGLSVAVHMLGQPQPVNWWEARQDSTNQAPDPLTTPEAVIQVYAARAVSWRGAVGVHTWVAVKPAGASHYTRLEVMGWGVRHGRQAVRIQAGVPDGYWFGSQPDKLVDLRGAGVGEIIARIYAAADHYPHRHEYRIWPGPNSNTFTAYIGRRVPELQLHLPPTAIGKDYLAGGGIAALAPSGTGFQLSLYGLAGLLVSLEEGIEINLLGLTAGIDVVQPALKLPGLGRIGVPLRP